MILKNSLRIVLCTSWFLHLLLCTQHWFAGLSLPCDAPLLLKGFGFSQLYLILWFWDGAPINISSYTFLHMIFIANYTHEIENTSNWEWYVKSLLLLGNLFKYKAANCYSICDSSFNPWALLLKLGKKRHCEMKVDITSFRDKVKIFSAWMVSNIIGEKKHPRYR